MRKKGGVDLSMGTIIPLLLTAVFFLGLFYFVYNSSSGRAVYEEVYAKQISLILTGFEDGMEIELNIDPKAVKIAKSHKKTSGIFLIDNSQKEIIVSFTNSKGYKKSFFSNYDFVIDESDLENNKIKIYLKED
jgi:hypothetical protein